MTNNDTPFRFEDLNDKPEPEAWGPVYDIKRKRSQSVGDAVREAQAQAWRREKPFHTNSPSGQPFDFSAAKHRARMKAEFTAQANADKRAWANGTANAHGWTILKAYAEAMKTKRLRETVNTNVTTAPRKPHYVLRAGQWQLKQAA